MTPVDRLVLEIEQPAATIVAQASAAALLRMVMVTIEGPAGPVGPAGVTRLGLPLGYLGGGSLGADGYLALRPPPLDQGDGIYRAVLLDAQTHEELAEATLIVELAT